MILQTFLFQRSYSSLIPLPFQEDSDSLRVIFTVRVEMDHEPLEFLIKVLNSQMAQKYR